MNLPMVALHAFAAIALMAVLLWQLIRHRRLARAYGWAFWTAVLLAVATGGALLVRSTPVWMIYGSLRGEVADPAGVLAAARSTVRSAGVCFLITLDQDGRPDARMMQPFPLDADMTVWLGTQRGTRKLAQIARDERASVACYDPATMGYVTLIGNARVVDDPAERSRHYTNFWNQFFKGPQDPAFELIRVTPVRVEVVSYGRAVATRSQRWHAATLVVKDGRWVGEE